MKPIVHIDPRMAELPFDQFKAWHRISVPEDPMTAKQRYLEIGGVIPEKQPEREKTTSE